MHIRSATEGDLPGILEIERLSFPIGKQWDPIDFNQALQDLFFIIGEEEIAGFLIACCWEDARRALITRIAVHPEYRGQDIATMLLKAAIEAFKERNISEVFLDVEIVKRGAIRLYENVGFRTVRGIPMSENESMNNENGSFFMMKMDIRRT